MSEREDESSEKTEEDETNQSEDNEGYSYSEDSISSDELTDDSEVTSVTRSLSFTNEEKLLSNYSDEFGVGSSKVSTPVDYQIPSYSSLNPGPTPPTGFNCIQRKNMSFSNMEMVKIERENQCLLRKIMAQQRQKKSVFTTAVVPVRLASSAINRKRMQRRIDEDNITILRKIQGAKSSSLSGKRVDVYKSTC
ncbi:cilia- and flagella-associated protein 97-like [Diachasmimorpha longicaudata]|uniref:cilia- and flagella-associated protein 97-like n=1 Tax=Diachasmimorpha longicaudata TaxID=58733 RepID=UPI0030B8864A